MAQNPKAEFEASAMIIWKFTDESELTAAGKKNLVTYFNARTVHFLLFSKITNKSTVTINL